MGFYLSFRLNLNRIGSLFIYVCFFQILLEMAAAIQGGKENVHRQLGPVSLETYLW